MAQFLYRKSIPFTILFMKKILLLLAIAGMASFRTTDADPISNADRAKLVEQLESSQALLTQTVAGLSAAQFNFRPAEGKWSILECIEHISMAEGAIFQWIGGSLKEPADSSRRSEIKVTDENLIQQVPNRSQKFNAPEMLQPKGSFATGEAGVKAFSEARAKTIEYAKTTQDDLRNHYMEHPAFGTIDTYQGMLLLAAHSKRHILQMQEVKTDPKFPQQ